MSPYTKLVKGATKIKVAPPKDKYMVPILNAIDNREEFNDIIYDIRVRISNNKQQWSIVFKSLIVIHMMIQENPRLVLDYLSTNLEFFNNMNIKVYNNNSKWATSDLSVMRRYNDYLECRANEWDTIKRYSSESRPTNKERLRYVQSLEKEILKLIRNKYSQMDLETDIFLFTFKLLVKDLLSLYNKLNEGVIKLLESFFDLGYEDAETTLDLYKRFVNVTESVVQYLRVGKALGLNIPVIKHITTKLIRSLEDHLNDRSNYSSQLPKQREQPRIKEQEQELRNTNENNDNSDDYRKMSLAAQKKLAEVEEEKRQLQQQLQQQQYLISPSTMSSNNPFSPQVDQFSFEPQQQQELQTTGTGNPFLMQQPIQVSYTNSPLSTAPPSYSMANQAGSSVQQQQQQQQSLAPARTTSMMINNSNPFGMDVLAENPGLMTDTTTGITYMPVPVQIAAVNPFDQQQQQQQVQQGQPQGYTLRQDSSLVDL